ncbi:MULTISPECIES: methylmalonyl-CoA mutase family protein [unclassified Rhodanobacter]|uniref:methylmalonyl-CoA mutase family protein n=1 Tax=unclassified Rhodanobacter TaxID=2621553 RepID=UPI001BE0667D|nr:MULTISPECIES: methylmalonyl-CoA mutase family protein [unclassified Rhodanobacter]MBT2144747.1 methylmalonyl-CoA mutase family protein [Rhodanobacter sp. LX-99]MBT2148792.1 methylmalonyl-CoA mutase family protein [Rhodanobacter sp. LX-100]
MSSPAKHVPASAPQTETTPLRFVTAASLFDGHDAAINIMRRIIQSQGAEVIHLGHNRSVEDVVRAALQEDADAIALSSYQGGHVEYFKYMVDMLRERGAGHVRVFGGGGGTITPEEIRELQAYGVERIYHPNDGMKLGLVEMIEDVMQRAGSAAAKRAESESHALPKVDIDDEISIGHMLSAIEEGKLSDSELEHQRKQWKLAGKHTPVLGLTGTGGAGKSSVVDELLLRFLHAFPGMRIAVLAVDPTRRRSGGALLGDRIRMNSLRSKRVYMRSMATRRQHAATSVVLHDCIDFLKSQPYDLVIVETAGIGQSDSEIVDLVDFPVYVMTSDYGAASQLEKIDMIDFADLVVLNKFDKRGAEDALRDVRKQWKRNHTAFKVADEDVPVYPTIASQFNDPGVTWMFTNLCRLMREKLALPAEKWSPQLDTTLKEPRATVLIPGSRVRYLAEIAEQGRAINSGIAHQAEFASKAQHYYEALKELGDPKLPRPLDLYSSADLHPSPSGRGTEGEGTGGARSSTSAPNPHPQPLSHGERGESADRSILLLRQRYNAALKELSHEAIHQLREWPALYASVTADVNEYKVRDKVIRVENYRESLSHQKVPKVAPPKSKDWGELVGFLGRENLPGHYPYTGGVYPYRRSGEDPTRMFAGEGTPERTNRRFHYLSQGGAATRLSTAFDSVTLYGEDPAPRPDIYGKIGNSGVNIATLDDMKKLYSGFDLSAPSTSVSMTINGPAPMILAMFMNTAIDQNVEKYLKEDDKRWATAQQYIDKLYANTSRPQYHGDLPKGNDGLGLGLLGVCGDELVDAETYARIKADTLTKVRGTVQADILKEDQAQNTCIFSTEFALRMMGDIQQYFVDHKVRNFYSVSISGYHIAEAGANPISQLAFTLSNGFTIVEYYLARGMKVDDFAPNLSFFFSNGMDPEYTVIGRVARRIWARAMRERYGASARSQMMKYHIQTSGRSLHAQEIQFNDIRTTLQAMYALFDNCNSLHTNAYDEAITTPTEESVRRAVAIQMIINKELGLNFNENPWQGSYVVDTLTDLVEEAVYKEFEAISERGGVLGAMDTMYQRGKIQEESMYYEHKKHDGSLPLIGVNTFLPKDHGGEIATEIELIRSTEEEKGQQIANVKRYGEARNALASDSLKVLQVTARDRRNVFEQLIEAVKYNSLGQISHALYEVGGEYRRNM